MINTVLLSVLLNLLSIYTQPDFILEKEYDIKADFISSDQLGNFYIIKNFELIKINADNNQTLRYSNNLFGKISSIDPSDPFRILVFNRDFNKIVFLDKNLIEITSPVLLDNLGYFNISVVCQSNNGGFWIFDQNLNELVYFDKKLNIQKKSSQLSSLFDPDKEISGVFMIEKNDYIYLGIKDEGVLLFDIYGTYLKTFPITDINSFQVIDNIIIYSNKGQLILYNTQNFNTELIDLPIDNCINSRIEQKKVFLQTTEKLIVYQLTNFK